MALREGGYAGDVQANSDMPRWVADEDFRLTGKDVFTVMWRGRMPSAEASGVRDTLYGADAGNPADLLIREFSGKAVLAALDRCDYFTVRRTREEIDAVYDKTQEP